MSKWPMRGHFRYLCFKTFPMTPRTPQCEVFWALLSNPKHSGVPEDSKSPTLGVLGFTPTLGQSGVATFIFLYNWVLFILVYNTMVCKTRWFFNLKLCPMITMSWSMISNILISPKTLILSCHCALYQILLCSQGHITFSMGENHL
jgi:hypothetical protein